MDSLKRLYEQQRYTLILEITEGTADPESVIYRVSSHLALNEKEKALSEFMEAREALYAYKPFLTLKSNFELRFLNGQFEQAYEDMLYFQNKPYVSQEVEEYLRNLPKLIRYSEKNESLVQGYTPEAIERILTKGKDDYEVLNVLNYLQNAPLDEYLPLIKDLLVSSRHPSVKTYALLVLVERKYPSRVVFSKNGKRYQVVPKDLVPPYTGPVFENFVHELSFLASDPSLAGVAVSLLNDYILCLYPEEVLGKNDSLLEVALLLLAREYLRDQEGMESLIAKKGLDPAQVLAKKKEVQEALQKEPPLKM